MKDIRNILIIVLAAIALWLFFDRKSIEIKTVETVVSESDTIISKSDFDKIVNKKPEVRYIVKRKGVEVVVPDVVDTDSIIEVANEYADTLKTNNATAYLKILTTGELKRLSGTIESKEITHTTTKTIERTVIKNQLYLGLLVASVNKEPSGYVFADYTIKQKYIAGIGYDPINKAALLKFGIRF